jgi:hypothetical protein
MSRTTGENPTQPTQTEDGVEGQLRELTQAVAELRAEMRRSAGAALPRDESAGWEDEAVRSTQAWVSALTPPRPATTRIPRLPFELAFLAGAAALAGYADLRPIEIAAVMAAAWIVVALAEWVGSRGDRLRTQVYLAPLTAPAQPTAPVPADPSWFTPPVEHTLLGPRDEQATIVGAPAPAPASAPAGREDESESTVS